MRKFLDRADAGRALAARLAHYRGADAVVLALPRGGVPVAYPVAQALDAELDVLIVRKLGVPYHPELAMGAIASGGAVVVNEEVVRSAGITQKQFEHVRSVETQELQRREREFRGEREAAAVRGRVAIVVDDGMATGASMRAALQAVRQLGPARLVTAVPVAPPDSAERLGDATDEFVCVAAPAEFMAVGQFYRNFTQTTDNEVRDLLERAHATEAP